MPGFSDALRGYTLDVHRRGRLSDTGIALHKQALYLLRRPTAPGKLYGRRTKRTQAL